MWRKSIWWKKMILYTTTKKRNMVNNQNGNPYHATNLFGWDLSRQLSFHNFSIVLSRTPKHDSSARVVIKPYSNSMWRKISTFSLFWCYSSELWKVRQIICWKVTRHRCTQLSFRSDPSSYKWGQNRVLVCVVLTRNAKE